MRHNTKDDHRADSPGATQATSRRGYPSDVTDRQWRKVQSLLPRTSENLGRPRETDLRDVVSAISYRWTTGCTWRMLPHDFPPWATVYGYFRQWEREGILPELQAELLRRSR